MKTALVTGASSGIGYECARELARQEYAVVLVARRAEALNATRQHCVHPERHLTVPVDITDRKAFFTALVQALEHLQSRLDLCVHSAGVAQEHTDTQQEVRRLFETNAVGTLNVLDAVQPLMRTGGHIGAISSLASLVRTRPGLNVYEVSKAAMNAVCEGMRGPLEAQGLSLTVAYPAGVDTPMVRKRYRASPVLRAFTLYDASYAAFRIVADIQAGRRESYLALWHRIAVPFARACPRLFAHMVQSFVRAKSH